MAVNASYEQYDRYINGTSPRLEPDSNGIDQNARTRALKEILLAVKDIRNTRTLLQAAIMELPDSDPALVGWKRGETPSVIDDTRGYVLYKALEAMKEPNYLEREKILNYAIARLPQTDEAFSA